ncbi:MAG: YciI family protein [Xanthobacteraceae bacterium]
MSKKAAALLAKMMKKELYIIFSTSKVAPEKLMSILADHLTYLIGLEKKNVLFASGPLTDENKGMIGNGITVVRAKSFKEATAIAKSDPFFRAGLRTFEVMKWTVNEGRIHVTVDLADQTGKLL